MVNFGEFIIGIILSGVFLLALIGFGNQMAIDNDTNDTILDNKIISQAYEDINISLLEVKPTTDSNQKGFFDDQIEENQLGIVLSSIVGIGSLLVNGFVQGVFQVVASLFSEALGINNTLIFGLIMSLFTITAILLAWRLYRAGN